MNKQYNECCKELKCYWKEGNYSYKLFSVEGLELISGTSKVEYIYKCCKLNGVKVVTEIPVEEGVVVSLEHKYCCDGKFYYSDSLGSKFCGKWNKKCCNLESVFCGVHKLLEDKCVKGKICEKKVGLNYEANVYKLEKCKYVLQYRYVYEKLLK
jgi:hypothetical protein